MPFRDLARGPARLATALGIPLSDDGADLSSSPYRIELPVTPLRFETSARTGVSGEGGGIEFPWRFFLPNDQTVSPYKAHVLALASNGNIKDGDNGGILRDGEEVLRGGTTIGLLERLAVAGTLLAGFPEGIAVIVAVKGVGRFSELADSATRERFIIGSLVSFIWACAATGVALLARG